MKLMAVAFLSSILLTPVCGQAGARKAQLEQPFSFKMGERVVVEGTRLKIRFLDVVDDSRCPEHATCVWAGNAEVKLKIGDSRSISVNTGIAPKEVEVGDYKIKLNGLSPYPQMEGKIDKTSYEATIVVTKK